MSKFLHLCTIILLLSGASPALAHKMKVFASAEGSQISGYAYFTGGGRVLDGRVVVTAPDGADLLETTTDEHGGFGFEARARVDHKITVDGGDGHQASYTIPATDLPETLATPAPHPSAAGGSTPGTEAAFAGVGADVLPRPAARCVTTASEAVLRDIVEQSVARQLRPLREQLDAWQEHITLHDVLGGLGTIIGMAGLAFGLSQRRRPSLPTRGSPCA